MRKLLAISNMKGALLSFIFIFSFSFCEGQSWEWGRQGNVVGTKPIVTCFITADAYGNAFITGGFFPSIIFGPDTLVDSIFTSDNYLTYFTKYNSAGTVQWAQQFTSSGGITNYPNGITEDASNNEIIVGIFDQQITIGSVNINSNNNKDIFLAKFDNNGNTLWALDIGDSDTGGRTIPCAITTDKLKNIYITGGFSGWAKFGNITLISQGDSIDEVFITKCDSNGNVLWAKQGTSIITNAFNWYTQGNAIACDAKDNLIITGSYSDSIVFGNDTLVTPIFYGNDFENLFLAKYDSAGNVLWAKQTVVPSAHSDASGSAVTTDNAENIYLTGEFNDTVSFGGYSLTEASPSHEAIFLAKYNSNGNVMWAKHANSDSYLPASLLSDENNNIYMSGGGAGDSITFGTYTLRSSLPNGKNSFMIKFDTSGDAVCGSMLKNGSNNYNDNYSATDRSGTYVYEVGVFFNDTIFCASDTLIAYGQNPYVARWQNCGDETTTPQIQPSKPSVSLFPNPNNGSFTIQLSVVRGQSSVEIYNVLGEKVYSTPKLPADIAGRIFSYNVNISSQPAGMYLYRLISDNGQLIGDGKFIIE